MANDPQTTPPSNLATLVCRRHRDGRLVRKCPYAASIVPRNPINLPVIPAKAGIQRGGDWERGARGLSPVGAGPGHGRIPRANSPYKTATPYLGVPATTGMGDWYENDVTRPRVCLNATAPALVVPAPQFVIPAKAGIHALTFRERTSTAMPPPTSTRRPHFVFPAKAPPEPRYGAGIQRGVGGANFHTFVCRRQPG